MMVADALVGRTVDERYRVDARLATGGMATVYLAMDLRLDRPVALKVMRPEYAEDPQFVSRFQQEARAAARLSHPNVVAVFDQGQSDGLVFLVMEFVAGRTLRTILSDQGRLSPSQSLAVLDPVLAGLAAAHRAGFVHRDVKPENVLVPFSGTIKVTDFGLARALQQPSNATTGMLIGTAAYLAPEHVSGGHSDERSDVYQAGILLYEMLSGTLPHTGDTAWSVAYRHVEHDVPPLGQALPGVSVELAELVESATRRDPDQRIGSVTEFLDQSRSIASHLPPPSPFEMNNDTAVISDPAGPNSNAQPDDAGTMRTEAAPLLVELDESSEAPDLKDSADPDDPPAPSAKSQEGDRPPPAKSLQNLGNRGSWRTGILLTLLAITATALAAWTLAINPFNRTDVPNVVGLTEAKAEKQLEKVGLDHEVSDRKFSEKAASGTVISADPDTGSGARVGSTVGLVVSMGPERYAVPKVRGLTPKEAANKIVKANLKVGEEKSDYHDKVDPGNVIGTSPAKRTKVKRDTVVDLIVSQGPAPVVVPSLVGLSSSSAQTRLEGVGLKSTITASEYSETVGEGIVIQSSPATEVTVHRGDVVGLVISKGPPLVSVPNVVDLSREEAVSKLEAAGLKAVISEGPVTPLDRVFSQDPEAGTSAPKGSEVTLSIF